MLSISTRKRVAATAVLAALVGGAVMAQQQGPRARQSRLGTQGAAR
jgi:hypothetical protein